MAIHDDDEGLVKTGVDEKAEARAAAAELRKRLRDGEKTASAGARKHLEEQLKEAERKLK